MGSFGSNTGMGSFGDTGSNTGMGSFGGAKKAAGASSGGYVLLISRRVSIGSVQAFSSF